MRTCHSRCRHEMRAHSEKLSFSPDLGKRNFPSRPVEDMATNTLGNTEQVPKLEKAIAVFPLEWGIYKGA